MGYTCAKTLISMGGRKQLTLTSKKKKSTYRPTSLGSLLCLFQVKGHIYKLACEYFSKNTVGIFYLLNNVGRNSFNSFTYGASSVYYSSWCHLLKAKKREATKYVFFYITVGGLYLTIKNVNKLYELNVTYTRRR